MSIDISIQLLLVEQPWYDIHVGPDGTNMFLATSGDYIRQYSLSTPFDPSSASYVREWNHTQYESNSFGFDISPDGQYLLLCGHDEDSIILFNMSTPWDLSTLTYGAIPYKKYDNLANATGATDSYTYSFEFNNDGTKVYFVAPNDRVVSTYFIYCIRYKYSRGCNLLHYVNKSTE